MTVAIHSDTLTELPIHHSGGRNLDEAAALAAQERRERMVHEYQRYRRAVG